MLLGLWLKTPLLLHPPVSTPTPVTMDTLVSLCKRRGFVFPSSEIYGGLNGFFDYGPLGSELRRNIRNAWWEDMVHRRDDIVGLDASIISHPKVWEASGHIQGFSDPMVDCKESKQRYRADQALFCARLLWPEKRLADCVGAGRRRHARRKPTEKANDMKRKLAKQGALGSRLRCRTTRTPSRRSTTSSPRPAQANPAR